MSERNKIPRSGGCGHLMGRSERSEAWLNHLRALSISMVTRVDSARDCGMAFAVVKISHGLVARYSSPGATGSSIPSPCGNRG